MEEKVAEVVHVDLAAERRKQFKRPADLPNLLILDNRDDRPPARLYHVKGGLRPEWIAGNLGCESLDRLPLKEDLDLDGYDLFCDEDGVQRTDCGLNWLARPLIDRVESERMAQWGGPIGPIALWRRGGISRPLLTCLYEREASDLLPVNVFYDDLMEEAWSEWDRK